MVTGIFVINMDQKFNTTSMYLAAYLLASGLPVSNANALSIGKYTFSFSDNTRASQLAEQFLLGANHNVNARRFVEEIKHIKALMYDR